MIPFGTYLQATTKPFLKLTFIYMLMTLNFTFLFLVLILLVALLPYRQPLILSTHGSPSTVFLLILIKLNIFSLALPNNDQKSFILHFLLVVHHSYLAPMCGTSELSLILICLLISISLIFVAHLFI